MVVEHMPLQPLPTRRPIRLFLLAILVLICGCSNTRPFIRAREPLVLEAIPRAENAPDAITFFALGDWGTGRAKQQVVARGLNQVVQQIPNGRAVKPFVLGLGDNVYEHGLPQGWGNEETLRLLEGTFGKVYSDIMYEGKPVDFHIVPGNHDHSRKAGYGDVVQQETTAERIYQNWHFYPFAPESDSGSNDDENYRSLRAQNIRQIALPQTIDVETAGQLDIFALDTEIMLQLYADHDSTTLSKHWARLRQLVGQSTARWKMIMGHHPIRSHGKHGGFRKAIWWVPPLTLVTLADKLFFKRLQDLDHTASRTFQEALSGFMQEHKIFFYLSGHEHNLQMLEIAPQYYQIVSGSAAKLSSVTHGSDTILSVGAFGFTRIDIVGDTLRIEFLEVNPVTGSANPAAAFRFHTSR